MEEAIQQLSSSSLENAKRKAMGPSGQITVTMDTRALAPDYRIFYRNLHKFRVAQMNEGVDLTDLSDEQWGMVQLDKCHHISTTSTSKDGPQSFRVRICKTCCQEDSHIELGTYVDQESAILVNDTFEILNERLDRLIVLRVEDKPDLHHLVAKKYDRSKGRDYACILDLISERINAIEGKKQKPTVHEGLPVFGKRGGDIVSRGSTGELHSSTQYSSCSTSSEASDEQRTAARLSGSKFTNIGNTLLSAAAGSSSGALSRVTTATRRPSMGSARKLSISSQQDFEGASQSGSASTIDDDVTVPEESNTAALRELSSVCYQRLLSPSINPTVPEASLLSPGTLLTGTSLFGNPVGGTGGTADLVRSLERARAGLSTLSSATHSTSLSASTAVGERLQLGSPFSNTSHSTVPANGDSTSPSNSSTQAKTSAANSGSTHKKRPAEEPILPSTTGTTSAATASTGAHNNERLSMLEGQTPRKRAATFSVAEPYPYHYGDSVSSNPIATLTWLASMEEGEMDVARSLFELRGASASEGVGSLFDTRSAVSMALGLGGSSSSGLGGGLGAGFGSYLDGYNSGNRMGAGDEMDYDRGEDNEDGEGYYDQEGDEGEDDGSGSNEGEEGAARHAYYQLHNRITASGTKLGSKPMYGYPSNSAFGPNGKLTGTSTTSTAAGAGAVGGMGAGVQRARSSSMSMLDRSEAAWAILGNSGGFRSRMDPLSMALKKYHERGGSANAAACGFVGIYSPEDRKQRILRFLEKRKRRMWTKKVKYDVRKNFADSRVRVKGRFVKKQDEEAAYATGEGSNNTSRLNLSHASCSSADQGDGDGDDGEDVGMDEEDYSHHDVDLELLEQLNAQQQQARTQAQVKAEGAASSTERVSPKNVPTEASAAEAEPVLSFKLRLGGNSAAKTATASSTAAAGGSGGRKRADSAVKAEVKVEGKGTAATTTSTSTRRRRNSRVEEDAGAEVAPAQPQGDAAAVEGSTSSPTAVAIRLERANLDSAVKPAQPVT